MTRHIRPYKIFELIEDPPPERTVNLTLPHRRGGGGTTLLETALIIAATRIVKARRAFEFGTFYGGNTLSLALNMPGDGEITTLDLDEGVAAKAVQHPADAPLTRKHLLARSTLDFAGSPVAGKIRVLTGDSTTFDFSQWKRSVDFLFIDGGHDLTTVTSDTANARAMACLEKPSCIMWHDYGNRDYPDLTSYLDELSRELEIFHIEDTMLCVWFNDPGASIVPRLSNQAN